VNLTAWRGRWRPILWLGGSYNAAFGTQEAGVVSLTTSMTSIRAVPSVQILELSVLQVDLGAGGGADVFYSVPSGAASNTPGESVALGGATTRTDPVLCGQLIARIRVLSSARIVVGLDVDYDAERLRYLSQAASPGEPTTVLEPWRVRPSAMVGVCVPLAGTVACAGPE
jgi:hypothetical protein